MFSDKPKVQNKKLTMFYGNQIARPYVVLKEDGEVDKERVGLPKINDALIDWASKVPFKQGGGLVKPSSYEGAEGLKQARTDFQIFVTERYTDILAANPGLADADDRRTLLAVASAFWRDRLSPEERKEFREKAQAEKLEVQESLAEKEAADPKLKTYREKLRRYKRSVGGILSAAKAQAAPLWQVQRRANKQYRKLQEAEAAGASDGEDKQGEEAELPKAKKEAIKKKASKKRKQVEESEAEDASDQEQEAEQQHEEQAAGRAGSKGRKAVVAKSAGGASSSTLASAKKAKAAKEPKAVAAITKRRYQEVKDPGEEPQHEKAEKSSNKQQQKRQQQQQADEAEGSGAAQLSRKLSKKKGSELYAGEYDLPPSQHASPAKARPSKGGRAKKEYLAGAEQPQQGLKEQSAALGAGAKRGRQGSREEKAAAGEVPVAAKSGQQPEPSAKKLRSSGRLRV